MSKRDTIVQFALAFLRANLDNPDVEDMMEDNNLSILDIEEACPAILSSSNIEARIDDEDWQSDDEYFDSDDGDPEWDTLDDAGEGHWDNSNLDENMPY